MALVDWISRTRRKAQPVRPAKDQPASGASLWIGGKRASVSYRDAVNAQQAMVHPVLFRILNKIAISVASVQWYIDDDPNAKPVEKVSVKVKKQLNDLLHSPNDVLAEDQLRYWMALSFASYGRIPLKIGVNTDGIANGIYGLDAQYVRAERDTRGIIKAYKYGTTDENSETLLIRRLAEKQENKPSYGHEIFTPNLGGAYAIGQNMTPLQACGLPADVINLLLRRAADTAAGHPNMKYIVAAEKTLTKGQKGALKETIEAAETGDDESGHILFLYNTKIDLHKLDNDLNDIHSKMPMDDMARMLAGLFGVPVALLGLGAADGAKFAGNYSESRESFWEDTIIPSYLTPIATGLTAAICPYGCRVRFDYDTIEALNVARATRAKLLEKVTFLDENEKRDLCGFGPRTSATPALAPPAPEPGTNP